MAWNCGFCGTPHINQETCPNCGAPYNADPTRSQTEQIIGHIDNIFLLNSNNRAVAMGYSRKIGGMSELFSGTGGVALLLVMAAGFVVTTCCCGILFLRSAPIFIAFMLLFDLVGIGILLTAAYQAYRNGQKNRRLGQEGQFLPGQLVEARRVRKAKSGGSYVRAKYQFVAPTGAMLTGEQRQTGGNYIQQIPPPGAPVVVVYADESCYKML